jgi:hypothetical protein
MKFDLNIFSSFVVSASAISFTVLKGIEKWRSSTVSKPVAQEFQIRDLKIASLEQKVHALESKTSELSTILSNIAVIESDVGWIKKVLEGMDKSINDKLSGFSKLMKSDLDSFSVDLKEQLQAKIDRKWNREGG